jgi:hypothetical protein
MSNDQIILTDVLERALASYDQIKSEADRESIRKYGHATTLLGQPQPGEEIYSSLAKGIEQCELFKAVQGKMILSANTGFILHSIELAQHLFSRAEVDVAKAVGWLEKVLSTKNATGIINTAVWGVSVEKQAALTGSTRILPFNELPDSRFKDSIIRRAMDSTWYKVWRSRELFELPAASVVRQIDGFPYISDGIEAFNAYREHERKLREQFALIEAASTGHPLAVALWFEYEDPDLDINAFENQISWSLPEVAPSILKHTPLEVDEISANIELYKNLPLDLRADLLRSMDRFTLSHCRRQLIDRVLDLALAFEIATSGGSSNAPISWKVCTRSAQLIGGDVTARQHFRDKINELFQLRNKATHGSSLASVKQADQELVLEEVSQIYMILIQSFLRFGKRPDWNELELDPAFR